MRPIVVILQIILGLNVVCGYVPGNAELSNEQSAILGGLTYLGLFNGTNYFIVRDKVTQPIATRNCATVGLQLASIRSQDVLIFICEHVEFNERAWVAGYMSFQNGDRTPVNPEIDIREPADQQVMGLSLDLWPHCPTSQLRVSEATKLQYYICSDSIK